MTVQPGGHIARIPENRHHVYPTSVPAQGRPLLHAPSYVAALWDGALSVGTLCGAASLSRITTEASRPAYDDCPDCLRWLNHLEPADG